MIRRVAFTAALVAAPAMAPVVALAGQTMPQMDFSNPLTLDQVGWMVVILLVLYFLLSRWALPQIGKVLAHRAATIAADLEAARSAKAEADAAVAELNKTMNEARIAAQAEITHAVDAAKEQARANALAQQERLDAQLAASEAQIAAAQATALAAIKPVAADTAREILSRLTGQTPDAVALSPEIDAAYAALKAA
jgi:F-type H+-transporting ATPase subunit b